MFEPPSLGPSFGSKREPRVQKADLAPSWPTMQSPDHPCHQDSGALTREPTRDRKEERSLGAHLHCQEHVRTTTLVS